jgi:hypothetical protein
MKITFKVLGGIDDDVKDFNLILGVWGSLMGRK